MKLSDLGEFGLIHAIRALFAHPSPSVLVGIGDDAAALKGSSSALLATTDMLVEGVHFDLSYMDWSSLGWKAAAVNLSDIAAMGGTPRFCLTSLAIPSHMSVEAVKLFYRGFNAMLKSQKTILVGGDTCASKHGLVVSVTVLGEGEKGTLITRRGAKRGDRIFVTGALGDSGAGLEILQARKDKAAVVRERGRTMTMGGSPGAVAKGAKAPIRVPQKELRPLIERHLRPVPRVEWGRRIARAGCASAMIDVSDGLSADLAHICEESGVGAVLFTERIPFSKALLKSAVSLKDPLLRYALSGGEDYELLFTVPPARVKTLEALRIPVTEVGVITTGSGLLLENGGGRTTVMKPAGYDHFPRVKRRRKC